MSRIEEAFEAARAEGRAALMPYAMGGFPDAATSRAVLDAYVEGGADVIELGVPFSDPLADGPVIHSAAVRAIAAGATLESVLELCRGVADRVPVVLMIYANMALAQGPAAFAKRVADSGAAGAIVPDLPHGEDDAVREALDAAGLSLVPLVAPTTKPERRREICDTAAGFIYVVSTTGVTGERAEVPPQLAELVRAVQDEASVPAAVGFGIGTPAQAAAIGRIADGVIVGSRLVREVADGGGPAGAAQWLREARAQLSR